MKALLLDNMDEATRLTRAGRLSEAVALIQSVLRGRQPGTSPQTATAAPASATTLPTLHLEGRVLADAAAPSQPILPRVLGGLDVNLPVLRGLGGRSVPASDIYPSAGTFLAKSFNNAAGTRAYKLYVPSRRADGPRPLIVMLHGCTQSADDFAAGTRMNFAAEEHGCFVAYPEQPAAANVSRCWNWFKGGDQQRGMGEPALIAGITRQIMADYAIDPRRIYVAGLSAGGAAAAIMGETYPDLYAGVGVHSGLACGAARDLPSAFAAMRGDAPARTSKPAGRDVGHAMPTIVFHGDRDTTVHPRNGAHVVARAGGDVQVLAEPQAASQRGRFTRSVRRDASGRSVLELWEIHGAGHAWSGGSAAGSFTDPYGPDATREMLRFFLEHAHPAN
ncbi:MAG TPA: PHB depolymerase family esterase [Hyphomicrobium sp.]|jgi:poly(hydroxyalkanoate) depolymerase family esterase